MPEIDVEREELDIDYHLEGIIAEMLRKKTTDFIDKRNYTVTLKNENDETLKETVTAQIEIHLHASTTLLEKASEEE